MQCPQCGTEIDDVASFCDECGIRVQETAVATLPSSAASSALGLSSPSAAVRGKSRQRGFPVADTRSFDRTSYNKKWNTPATAISHWNQFIRGLDVSAMAFYGAVRAAIERRNVPDVKLFLVEIPEGGIFSAKRDYLRVRSDIAHATDVADRNTGGDKEFFPLLRRARQEVILYERAQRIAVLHPQRVVGESRIAREFGRAQRGIV